MRPSTPSNTGAAGGLYQERCRAAQTGPVGDAQATLGLRTARRPCPTRRRARERRRRGPSHGVRSSGHRRDRADRPRPRRPTASRRPRSIEQIDDVRAERDALVAAERAATPQRAAAAMLLDLKGVGPGFAGVLWSEGLFRRFENRRQLAAYAGLAPTPWQSGSIESV